MDAAAFRKYCLKKPGTMEDSPFGPEHIVFKVGGKMFALLAFEEVPPTANLKCDPDRALELRDRYEQVRPGYHMNKKHWNTVELNTGLPEAELRRMIDDSYALVVRALPKRQREQLLDGGKLFVRSASGAESRPRRAAVPRSRREGKRPARL
ncbi:MAG: MmcQ/YjbR family DNA-binding protein [Chthoniobacterales bacterium]|nr:MmcQ/YjbR family DNA-binding protein [Chthoniobacterales bacterium]